MTAPYIQPVNIPSKPITQGAATGRNQKDRRWTDTFFDNHRHARFPNGRPWCGPRELAANRETTPPPQDGFCIPDLMQGEYVEDENGMVDRAATLRSSWTAPWRPLAKYFRFNYAKKRITFDYAIMRREEEQSLQEYYAAAAKLGSKLNIRVVYGEEPDFQITSDIGYPTKYLKIAEAAMAGDPWLLGFIDDPNPELAAILGFNQRGMRVTSYDPPAPLVTPAQVIATPDNELLKMIADMQQQMLLMQKQMGDEAAKKAADKEKMAKLRAKRGKKEVAA